MTRARNLANLGNKNAITADIEKFNIGIGSTQPTSYKLEVVGGNAYVGGGVTITGNLSVGGTVTYEDVTNVDAVGIITAAKGFRATDGGIVVTAGVSTFPVVAVSAGTTTKDLKVTGISTFNGAATFGDNIYVTDSAIHIVDSIVHYGDTDTNIGFPAVDTFTIDTAGSERLRITSAGLVGIGTNNPAEDLHIGSNSPYILLDDYDNARKWKLKGTAWFAIEDATAGAERLRITSAGRVGIGTDDPSSLFEVAGATPQIRSTDTDAANDYSVFQNSSGSSVYNAVDGGSGGAHIFQAGGTEKVRITSAGRVGINETSPDTMLHVRNDNSAAAKIGGQGGAEYYMEIGQLATSSSPGFNATGSSTSMLFQINGTEKLRIKNDGSVGIGTNNPENILHLESSSNTYLQIEKAGTASKVYVGNAAGDCIIESTGGQVKLKPNNTSNKFILDTSGRLLLGGSASQSVGGGQAIVQIQAVDSTGRLTVTQHRNEAGGSPYIVLGKSRGTAVSAVTILQDDDDIGTLAWAGADGSDMDNQAAAITAQVDGTPGADDMPGRLLFKTTADGASSATERLRITSTGKVCINNDTALSDLHVCTAGSSEQDGTLRIGGSNSELGLVLDYDQASNTVARIMANPTYNNAASLLKICTDGDTNPNMLVLEGNGRIGFGTDNPGKQIDIRAAEPFLRLQDDTASSKRLDLWVASSNGYIGCNQSSQELHLQTTGSDAIVIDSTQAVNCKRELIVSGNASGGTSGYIVMQGYDTSIAAGASKTFTFSGMTTGWADVDIGGYAAAGQAATSYAFKLGGYQTQTYTWWITVLANQTRNTTISATQNASDYAVTITNNATNQAQYFHIGTRSSVAAFTCAFS